MEEKKIPDRGLAVIFSFLFSGLGQLYKGEITKGLVIMFFSTICLIVLLVGALIILWSMSGNIILKDKFLVGSAFFVFGMLGVMVVGIYNIYDAYNSVTKK